MYWGEEFGGIKRANLDGTSVETVVTSIQRPTGIALLPEEQDAITAIRPRAGGDTGSVTVHIFGSGFAQDATAKLVRSGETDIVGAPVTVGDNGTTITTTFDLVGKTRGVWDVVVENPDGTTIALPGGFTIEEGRAAQLWADRHSAYSGTAFMNRVIRRLSP